MERKSCCSGMRSCSSSNTRVTRTTTIKKEEDVKPQIKKEVVHQTVATPVKTEAKDVKVEDKVATTVKKEKPVKRVKKMERKSCCSGMRSRGSSNTRMTPTMTIKKEEDVKPQIKKEVVHQPAATTPVKTEAKGVKIEEKVATTVKKEEPVKVNVGCGGVSSELA